MHTKHDALGERMKKYEYVTRDHLLPRSAVIVRIDGCHFHSFTKGFQKPEDPILTEAMRLTAKYLCKNVQNCKLSYQQSDEISLLLTDYDNLNTCAWFDNNIQKIASVTASIATMAFNWYFRELVVNRFLFEYAKIPTTPYGNDRVFTDELITDVRDPDESIVKRATFDCRCFNLPKEEVTNYFYWRQLDATRNAILTLGQQHYTQKQLHGKSCKEIKEMLLKEKGIDFEKEPTSYRRGTCCVKQDDKWTIDTEIPTFKGNGREYIDKLVFIGD